MDDIYLDHNASTPLDPRVKELFISMLDEYGNASSIHRYGRKCKNILLTAREKIASSLGVKEDEVIFTSGGTEGMQLLMRGILEKCGNGQIISSPLEHSCTTQILEALPSSFEVKWLPQTSYGAAGFEDVRKAINLNTRLVCLMAANNETGVKTDIDLIAPLLYEKQIPFIVDGIAILGKEKVSLPQGILGMAFSGHKIHAPKGTGFVVIKRKKALAPVFAGGGQEYGLRGGTENVPGIAALAEAVYLANEALSWSIPYMESLKEKFLDVIKSGLTGVHVNGDGPKVSNTLNLYFEEIEGEELLVALDLRGVAASHGSACSSGALEPSRVLLSMGYPIERVRGSLRFSFSRMSKEWEVKKAAEIIVQEVKTLRNYLQLH